MPGRPRGSPVQYYIAYFARKRILYGRPSRSPWHGLPDKPDLHGFIVAGRGDAAPIGRPRDRAYPIAMAAIAKPGIAARSIPHVRGLVACRDELPAIGRPYHRVHYLGMSGINEQEIPIRTVLSSLAEAIRLPSGDHATALTRPL